MRRMTYEQRVARNEGVQLIQIASRILKDAGLVAYADDAQRLVDTMKFDARTLLEQEKRRQGI